MEPRSRCIPAALVLAVAAGLGAFGSPAGGQQRVADYAPPAFQPRFVADGPVVAIDAGHRELHTLDGTYAPLARLLRADGVHVQALAAPPLSQAALQGVDVLVVSNARPAGEAEDLVGRDVQAFTGAEAAALDAWVAQGGSLLLVADHYPFGGYAQALSARFGVRMGGGYAADAEHANADAGDDGQVLFRRATGGLGEHWITAPLATVQSFTGQALQPGRGTCLLRLGEHAERFEAVATRHGDDVNVELKPAGSAGGWCQGVAAMHGRGRVVVLGEAAMITAQLDHEGKPFGMQAPGDDNELFALQVVRWLAHADARDAGNDGMDGSDAR
jgi:hypothetical protein